MKQVLATLAPVALFALVWAILFLVFRKWFARNYRPRTCVSCSLVLRDRAAY